MFIVEAKAQDNKKFTDNAQEVCGNLVFINDLNVINYYNLQDTYNTELKISVYKKTSDYQEKLEALRKLKQEMLSNIYYIRIDKIFTKQYQKYVDGSYNLETVNYDLTQKGFNLILQEYDEFKEPPKKLVWTGRPSSHKLFPGKDSESNPCDEVSFQILLKKLPSKIVPYKMMGQFSFQELLFIPMDESNALEIENNRENVVLFIFFKPNGKEIITYKEILEPSIKQSNYLKSDYLRILIVNENQEKIYYDKTFN